MSELTTTRRQQIAAQLLDEEPLLHWATQAVAEHLTKLHGVEFKEGPISHALPQEVLEAIRVRVAPEHLTLETGSGRSTVLLAALSRHHICISPDYRSVEMIKTYMDGVGLPQSQVTFIEESSDGALPQLQIDDELDFVLIDGCHGYPYPSLEWHYTDFLLREGGVMVFDNTEFECVSDHCNFLDRNPAYSLLEEVRSAAMPPIYSARFYEKVRHTSFGRELPRSRRDLTDPYADRQ